jgi:signal transduction histidine kinase
LILFDKHKTWILLAIGLVSIFLMISFFLMGIQTHDEIDEIFRQQCNEQQLLLARQISTGIEEFLNQKVDLIEILATNEADASYEEYEIYFKNIYDGSNGFYALEFINESGVVVSGYPKENVPIGYDLYENNQQWAIEHVKNTEMTYCTNPLGLFEGGFGSFIWVPVFEGEEEYKGTILGIIQLSTISKKYLEPYNSFGYIYMVDRKGQILFDGSDQYTVGNNYFEILNESNPEWAKIIQEQVEGSERVDEYHETDTSEHRIIAYSPIHWHNRLWSVAVTSPVEDINIIFSSVIWKQTLFVIVSIVVTLIGSFSMILLLVKWNQSLEVEVKEKTFELSQSNKLLEKANIKLKQLDQLKSDFLSIASHELKAPLRTIKDSVELLAGAGENEKVNGVELTEKITKNVDRQMRMVDDLLDITKIESGVIDYTNETVNLQNIIGTAIETIEKTAYDLGISIHTSVPDELSLTLGNRDTLISVFVNLLNFSLNFIPWGGRIDINVVELDDCIKVTIKDNGIGFEPDKMDKIFEKFYKVDEQYEDTGLGLAIAKGVVEGHGGTIHATSKKGDGTRFTFTLKKWEYEHQLFQPL